MGKGKEEIENNEELENEIEDLQDDAQPESARETAARVLSELQEETESDDAESELATKKAKPQSEQNGTEGQKNSPEYFEIDPPARFKVEHKQVFNKLPDDLKKATSQMIRDQESAFTKAMQKASQKEKEAASIIEAVRPYYVTHPELADAGMTESQFAARLIAAHTNLTSTDQATRLNTFASIGEQIGLDREILGQILNLATDSGNGKSNLSNDPTIAALQKEINDLKSERDQAKNLQQSTQVSGILAQMKQVRDATDANGNYLYPKLHDGEYLERLKPLVSALKGASPNIGYGEALKRAYAIAENQDGVSNQVNQTGLSAQTNNQTLRATTAAKSVRGRSAPTGQSGSADDIPEEALGSAKDTVRWALNTLRG